MDPSHLTIFLERRQFGNIPIPIKQVRAQDVVSTCIVCGILALISWIAVTLRLVTRSFRIGALGKDDWVILVTQVSHHACVNTCPDAQLDIFHRTLRWNHRGGRDGFEQNLADYVVI